ncbi:NUMOD4 motif-containing HNH endonuclease [Staphylococcus chromogenes]|uniref:NUMOD4 motif-containing HNH endonuclease n=1 Tax=Staphylococcus chromogenes TaxID=46126 RepID=UPI002887B598|nr:NUMOD4 motif-containing HNH endonuclease [Staphylococcus chromogenes]MDT0750785.1 NUMOD4 motif-containing HNH endonuclease [Staphylococcus chromogenes]
MKEIWRDVVGYEGIYEVSNHGRVRTHADKVTWSSRHKTWRHWKQRYLKDKTPNGRDVRVSLWKDGKVEYFLVHRLVAYAFIPTIEGKDCINHIDGNPKNNNVENLEWCNRLENNRHAFENGLIDTQKAVSLSQLNTGIKLEFKSMAKADEWLDRSIGYTSCRLQRKYTTVVARDNTIYKIEKLI